MKRRMFLFVALGAGMASVLARAGAQARGPRKAVKREYYELRRYAFADARTQERFEGYLKDAFLPALKRLGNGPVGVFSLRPEKNDQKDAPETFALYVLIPHAAPDALVTLPQRLETDAAYRAAGASLLDLPSSDPPYTRLESWLLSAFDSYPQMHVPAEAAAGKGRTFELRTYESHSKKAGKKKIEMFNVGETDIFVRAGFQPVFFGETLVGSGMPSLTYMVTYADGMERGQYWAKFSADPEKTRLFAMPEYADKEIVSKIHAVMLRPTAFSQI
jgi:hypothetical protein